MAAKKINKPIEDEEVNLEEAKWKQLKQTGKRPREESSHNNNVNSGLQVEKESTYRTLLTNISDHMVAGSHTYNNFVEHMKPYGIPNNILAHEHNNLLKLFEALEDTGYLHAGNYTALKDIAIKSRCNYVLKYIDDAEHGFTNILHKELQEDLISCYKKRCSDLQISPFIQEHASNLLELYVSPTLTMESENQKKSETVSSYQGIFIKKSKECQNIYISSPAGCGKTSFAKRMALTWCHAHQPMDSDKHFFSEQDVDEMKKFKYLFLIYLRESHERECYIDTIILSQLLYNLAKAATYEELGLKFLQNLLRNEKCLIIIDGLDEWSHPVNNNCRHDDEQIPHNRDWKSCTILTTSRPWKIDVARLKLYNIDQMLELNPLSSVLLKKLIGNVVRKLNELYNKEMDALDFEELVLRKNAMTALSQIPLIVMQLVTLWFDNEPIGKSQCEIYLNMILFLLNYSRKKRENDVEMEERNAKQSFSNDGQILQLFQMNINFKISRELLLKLGELAFHTLFCDQQQSLLIFDMEKYARKYLSVKDIEIVREVGILTHEKGFGMISRRQSDVSFLHKTFQEFLASLYVALTTEKEMQMNLVEKIKSTCCSMDKILEFSQIFMFICGLCPQVMSQFYEHLRHTVCSDYVTKKYRSSCELDPRTSSEGRTLRKMQDTLVTWLQESWLNNHENLSLPLNDVFIDIAGWASSMWSDALKSLVTSNTICSLFISCETVQVWDEASLKALEEIVSPFTAFTSFQKLWLSDVNEEFVYQLLFQTDLDSKKLRDIECVYLENVCFSGNIIFPFVESILKLPNSVKVSLKYCHYDDNLMKETNDWREYIRSNHQQFKIDRDITYEKGYYSLLQFHTKHIDL